MHMLLGVAILVLAVFAVVALVSRRKSLPCPVWLGWMVEMDNPFTKTTVRRKSFPIWGWTPA
mgnify:CR=1 FL=1